MRLIEEDRSKENIITENKITPKSINTKVKDIMEGARVIQGAILKRRKKI